MFLIANCAMCIFSFGSFSQASPGNLQEFEEVLFGNNDMSASAVVMAIKLGTDIAGQKVLLSNGCHIFVIIIRLVPSIFISF